MASILLVCTGNICRSPMAEGFLRRALEHEHIDSIEVQSAGVAGWAGSPAVPEAVEVAAERDVDLSRHVARRLNHALVESADVVITMTADQRDSVRSISPQAASRTFTLKELVHLLPQLEAPEGLDRDSDQRLRGVVAAANALRRSENAARVADEDVADPLGLGMQAFQETASEIEALCDRLVEGLMSADGAALHQEEREESSIWG